MQSSVELDRVKADLETMRAAIGAELPFGRREVWVHVATSVAGILMMGLWVAMGPQEPWPLTVLSLPVLPLVATWALTMARYRRERHENAARVHGYALQTWLVAGLVLLMAGSSQWAGALAVPDEVAAGVSYGLVGVVLMTVAAIDRRGAVAIGAAIGFVGLGALFPWAWPRHSGVLFGGFYLVVGLSTAGIMAHGLRARDR